MDQLLSRKPAIFLKRGKIRPRLLWRTNRKLHMHFWFVPKSVTMDDLEQPVSKGMRLWSLQSKKRMKTNAHNQQGKRKRMILVSDSIRSMRILAGFPRDAVPNNSGVVQNDNIQPFHWLFLLFWNFRNQGTHYYTGYVVPHQFLSDPQIHVGCKTLLTHSLTHSLLVYLQGLWWHFESSENEK